MTELLFSTAFTLWPLAAISSVLYFFLFWSQRLYGEALLQVRQVEAA